MMARLLAEIRINRERMEAKIEADIKIIQEKIETNQKRTEAKSGAEIKTI
jgi:polyhydroxyalkanoate synthesis regulator phasin